jgi:ribosomal protein S4
MSVHDKRRRDYYRKEFTYNLKKKIKFRRRKRFKKEYLNPRLLYNYYFFIRRKSFLKYAKKAKRKNGLFLRNYLEFIEGKLIMLIYRSNFISNIFKIKYIVDRGIFLVNSVKRYYVNYNVSVGDLIQVDLKYKRLLSDDLKIRLKYFNFFVKQTYKFIFINYKFMFIFFVRSPKYKEIKYPLKLDVYLGSSLYFL